MNYAGKFDATIAADGPGTHHSPAYIHIDSPHAKVPPDAIVVTDAHLLFNADFKRSGVDLILSKDDAELMLHDYFKGEKRAPLASPDGAHLTGDLVNALTGHVQYSQAGTAAAASHVIGHVTKLAGNATAIRNGVSILLHQGDNVEKGDVVQSGADSTLGITFIDGTVFGLSSNARMVLNEMVYDPNGSNNASLMSLVAGTISFVAGETAKHGDMKIDTPVATMGIRGTAVLVEIDFTVPQGASQPDAKFQVLVEPDGTTGSYILFDKTTLQPIAVVNQAGQQVSINNGVVSTSASQLSPDLQKLITDVFAQKFAANDSNTKLTQHTDSTNPDLFNGQLIKTASGATATPVFLVTGSTPGSSSSSSTGSGPLNSLFHISGALTAALVDPSGLPKTSFAVDDVGLATVRGVVNFADINVGDTPTVTVNLSSFSYQNAEHQDISANLTALQLAEITAAINRIALVPDLNNKNFGSATWTYAIPGAALDFLAPGQTLTLSYVARVDNNFAPLDEFTLLPFAITITGVAAEVWIATTPDGGLWSDPSKWKSVHIPTATDDVIVMTDPLHGLTPSFPVTINAPAVAGSLTMNDFGTTAPVLINQSTLTIGSSLTIAADSVIQNFGAISVGGVAEILNQSVLLNSGTLNLAQGGDFRDQSSITNTGKGTIDVTGGTLNVLVDVANSGKIIVESGATLSFSSGTSVTNDGTIEVKDATLKVTGSIAGSGSVQIDSGALFELNGSDVQNVVFAGTSAEMQIDASSFGGSIVGLAATDELDLRTIGYGLNTTGIYVSDPNNDGGILTITDGSHSISMTLVGDYRNAHFAGSTDGNGGTLITLNAADDVPAFVSAETTQSGVITELSNTTGSSVHESVSGSIHFTDIDLTDRPTATITSQTVTWTAADHTTDLSSSLSQSELNALEQAISLIQSNNTNNGVIGWTYSIADSSLDFLAAGDTAKVVSTVTLNDHQGGTDTATVTITITGTNDAPVIVDETDPSTQTVILARSPIVLDQGVDTNLLGLQTETFDSLSAGSPSNNGFGHGNFFDSDLGATFTGSGEAGVVNGSSSTGAAAPFVGPLPGHADTTNYLSIGADSTETITFTAEQNAFGLYWGSVDPYNTIDFYDGTKLVASYTGADVSPLFPDGNQGSFSSNGYVEFSDLAPFNKVVLGSGENSFEIDNVSAGFISDSHIQLASPITGTLTVSDADIGDTLTASVIGDAVITYDGSTTLPSDANVAALIDPDAVTFDSVTTNGGLDVLHWTYNPSNPDLDFLEPGDTLSITFKALVSDGHVTTGDQSLTVTIVGTGASVVNGTAQNDTFVNVGGNVTIFGNGGQDAFVFKPGFAAATIGDFDVSKDTIDIDHTLFASVSAILASAQPANSGHDTIITDAAHDKITLTNVTVAQLNAHPNDFHLI